MIALPVLPGCAMSMITPGNDAYAQGGYTRTLYVPMRSMTVAPEAAKPADGEGPSAQATPPVGPVEAPAPPDAVAGR